MVISYNHVAYYTISYDIIVHSLTRVRFDLLTLLNTCFHVFHCMCNVSCHVEVKQVKVKVVTSHILHTDQWMNFIFYEFYFLLPTFD